jgi:hypothetical protein
MDQDLLRLYQELSYSKTPIIKSVATEESLSLETVETPEETVLTPEGAIELEKLFEKDPKALLEKAQDLWDRELTEEELREGIQSTREMLTAPEEGLEAVVALKNLREKTNQLPSNFTFPGQQKWKLPIDPSNHKFQTGRDLPGWIAFTGPFLLNSKISDKAPFQYHSDKSPFIYPIVNPNHQETLRIALFADFGTGLDHSRYIAKLIEDGNYPYAIHLGDVYYAGRQSEFDEYFIEPLRPLLAKTRLFTMNGNHEMYSGGIPYFRYINNRLAEFPGRQQQEGSYFCLQGDWFQIIGIDTDYFDRGRLNDPRINDWLKARLKEGIDQGKANILLSGDEPYSYGKEKTTDLFEKDIKGLISEPGSVILWFWGNTHYCALFNQTEKFKFIGCCIGHGGYPYSIQKSGDKTPAPVLFLEDKPRFPEWTRVRQDRGNNGFCYLSFPEKNLVEIHYIDWMGNERCLTKVRHQGKGKSPEVESVTINASIGEEPK